MSDDVALLAANMASEVENLVLRLRRAASEHEDGAENVARGLVEKERSKYRADAAKVAAAMFDRAWETALAEERQRRGTV